MFTQALEGSERRLIKASYESEFIFRPVESEIDSARKCRIGIIQGKIKKKKKKKIGADKNPLYPPYQVIFFHSFPHIYTYPHHTPTP